MGQSQGEFAVENDSARHRSDSHDPALRARLLELLSVVGKELPSMRFGQLVSAMACAAEAAVPDSIYDIEDHELIASIEEQLAFLKANR